MRTLLMLVLALPAAALAGAPADLELNSFATGLNSPLAVRHAGDGSGRVYVVQQTGQVIAYSAAGVALGTVLNVSSGAPRGFSNGGERGLLGLAFHPDYPTDPRLFAYYTDVNGDTVVASWDLPSATGSASDPEVLLRVNQDFSNHNGGDLHFGADGYLYIALGDGGSGGDPCNRAQTLDPADLSNNGSCAVDSNFLTGTDSFPGNADSRALLGKLLRIDVDGSSVAGTDTCGGNANGAAPYAIPPSNPFAGGGTANGCGEVWHYGLRNPYRFSFDRDTGDLYIGDVGQGTWEEINLSAATSGGLNFGWNVCEGDHLQGQTGGSCTLPGATPPILEYPTHANGGCAVTGGYLYRGPISELQGNYIYGDYCNGRISIATQNGVTWTSTLWRDTSYSISSFGDDEAGNLYLTHLGGQVLRFEQPVPVAAVDDHFDLVEDDGPTNLDVLANDTGPAPLTITSTTTPVLGTLENLGTLLRYTPLANACGADGFSYTTSAGASAAVTLAIACVDDGAAVAVDDAFDIAADSAAQALDVLANDILDPDPEDGPTVVIAVGNAGHGSVANAVSHVLYTPDAGYCGPDGFSYSVSGGSQAEVAITVHCDAFALDDHFSLFANARDVPLDVLANDAGPPPLSIASVDFGPINGSVSNQGSHLLYTPAPDWCGQDLLNYTTSAGVSAAAVLDVQCRPLPIFDDGFEPVPRPNAGP